MIKINLIGKERSEPGQVAVERQSRTAMLYFLIVIATLAGLGWWYMSLKNHIAQLEDDKTKAEQEKARLVLVIKQVEEYEIQKKALETRVNVIENLKRNQAGPVHMLDEVSKALPEFLWIGKLIQSGGNQVRLEGQATSYNAIADFITNLDQSGYFANTGLSSASRLAEGQEVFSYSIQTQFAPKAPPAPPSAGQPASPTPAAPPRAPGTPAY